MTKEEIKKFLSDTKVYVNGKSEEIQKKLFSFGYKWNNDSIEVLYTNKPFLFIDEGQRITYDDDMNFYIESSNREITAEEILSLKLSKLYRPFKNKEECWNEMLKHEPFGWIKNDAGNVFNIIALLDGAVKLNECYSNYSELFKDHMFMDGTLFGIIEK